ncbi:MAG: N-6 DNA methylase, partial [Rhodobacteraceae bacterium]|nr:N-6 DNA methylase [Paracoccaceae bacterium]
LPIAVSPDRDPAQILNSGREFEVVWSVLRALRSHDDRFDAEINKIDLNREPTKRIVIIDGNGEDVEPYKIPFPPLDVPAGAIFAKVVENCGDRKYWKNWAKDVADIFSRLVVRIRGLLEAPGNEMLKEWFGDFHGELKATINDSITVGRAIDMMAQHILTRPVFEALFDSYEFARRNPIARALEELRHDFGEFGLEHETRDLKSFYDSVRLRAQGLDNIEARQRVLMELYEHFFAVAMKKDAERLGIVYTPTEIVDFILASTNHALRSEFGCSLSDKDVHILDPFTGTGIFLARLLQSELIGNSDVGRKFREEIHANEIVLLAYYIAAIQIELAFVGRGCEDDDYVPFGGIVLTDTFNLNTTSDESQPIWMPENNERAERQQKLPIRVIVGNPPWRASQTTATDDNPNVDYPELEQRVSNTYAARSTATNQNSLYDSYKLAIRWASDRIGDKGLIGFVTNGSWLAGNVDSGVRACLSEEFSSIHVLNLRGNQRTQGELSRREGGKVFGQGSRAPVAIAILVKNPDAAHEGCRILYRDIGDYLSRERKLAQLREWVSIGGIDDWRTIVPDRHHDWIGRREAGFDELLPLGTKECNAGRIEEA